MARVFALLAGLSLASAQTQFANNPVKVRKATARFSGGGWPHRPSRLACPSNTVGPHIPLHKSAQTPPWAAPFVRWLRRACTSAGGHQGPRHRAGLRLPAGEGRPRQARGRQEGERPPRQRRPPAAAVAQCRRCSAMPSSTPSQETSRAPRGFSRRVALRCCPGYFGRSSGRFHAHVILDPGPWVP
jgi:hypothetical protein